MSNLGRNDVNWEAKLWNPTSASYHHANSVQKLPIQSYHGGIHEHTSGEI